MAESLGRRRAAYERRKKEEERSQPRRTLERDLEYPQEPQRDRRRRLNGGLVETRSSSARSGKNRQSDYRTSTARNLLRKKADRIRIAERTQAILQSDKRTCAARALLRKISDHSRSAMRV